MLELTRDDGLITSDEAAALCGVSRATLLSWVYHKRLPVASRDGWRLLFNLLDVARVDQMRGADAPRPEPRPSWGPAGLDAEAVLMLALAAAGTASRSLTPEPVVYYLQFADRIKIGTTTCLRRRLGVIPHDRLLATEPGGADVERQRHEEFAEFRIIGEWFRACQPIRDHIARIGRRGRM